MVFRGFAPESLDLVESMLEAEGLEPVRLGRSNAALAGVGTWAVEQLITVPEERESAARALIGSTLQPTDEEELVRQALGGNEELDSATPAEPRVCAHHPGVPAVLTCGRCGDFVCEGCCSHERTGTCNRCEPRLLHPQQLVRARGNLVIVAAMWMAVWLSTWPVVAFELARLPRADQVLVPTLLVLVPLGLWATGRGSRTAHVLVTGVLALVSVLTGLRLLTGAYDDAPELGNLPVVLCLAAGLMVVVCLLPSVRQRVSSS